MKKIITLFILGLLLFSCKGNENDNVLDKYEAKLLAEKAVKTRLKSPSSAIFSKWNSTETTPKTFNNLKGFKVNGFFESKNSFGGMVKRNYSVEIYQNNKTGNIQFKNLHIN
ncbi:hypothetical protein [Tenacibaculum maritimum]|uniref:hypothetical protein n=1 Tax=Tenacibaculum maritimum TaxID=107401 RepID=UPI0012E50488|nr:hypothetical protein [Tenacibaculum maritimum]MDB0602721.1 hypothetical protein [Tenacibaculum maritimum]MDB0612323.1 hypothetical protein [Tenacibaculum maritimum]CAA0144324.1 conserved hypothetical protein [Tenacibaculum maritimum]CAA0194026.1 conserved hypothetical protein [Tenacibaculum maritimum]CAA0195897.1 conserved hypothetical protein [Tenacibaculum maritimum]